MRACEDCCHEERVTLHLASLKSPFLSLFSQPTESRAYSHNIRKCKFCFAFVDKENAENRLKYRKEMQYNGRSRECFRQG